MPLSHRPAQRRLFDPFQSCRQSAANGSRRGHPLCRVAQTHRSFAGTCENCNCSRERESLDSDCHFSLLLVTKSAILQCTSLTFYAFIPPHFPHLPQFFHIYAYTVSMLYPAWKGQTVITKSGRFDLEQFCQLVQEHKPERAHLVPPILLGLAKHPVVDQYDLSSLQCIISAAAPLSKETEKAVKGRIGCEVKQAWGMSELSPIGTINSDYNMKSGSVGQLISSTLGKILDENGRSLPPNTPGELAVHGPQVMLGYLDEPDKTKECLSDSGWLRTGDVAQYDEDGFVCCVHLLVVFSSFLVRSCLVVKSV